MDDSTTTITVLLVDDEEDFLEVTSKVLQRRGLRVLTATTGAAAIEELTRTPVDAVVLDMKMPGLSGAETFDLIKRACPDLPVIVLTGHGTAPQAFQMIKGGVYDYLTKPCNIDAIAATVRRAAAERGAARDEDRDEEQRPPEIDLLLVDDEKDFVESMKRVLERRGIRVLGASSGAEALEILQESSCDVVVLDVKLPGMDGLEVLRRLRARSPNLPVILLTGHPSVSGAVESMRVGAVDYVSKPPDVESLVSTIRRAFAGRQQGLDEERNRIVRDILERYTD